MDRPIPLFKVILVTLLSGFLSLGLGVFLSFYFIVTSSADQKAATCAVVEHSRAEKRAQLQAFDETPPTTDAGRGIQEAYRESLDSWDSLWKTLGCKEAAQHGD